MARLTPRFSANRAVCEYTEQHYLPAAETFRSRTADQGSRGSQIVAWRGHIEQTWDSLQFGEVKVETKDHQHVFEVQVHLAEFDPKAVRVELYADGVMGRAPERQEMARVRGPAGASGDTLYGATVSTGRPATDYTPRVIPRREGVAVPLEAARILWQR